MAATSEMGAAERGKSMGVQTHEAAPGPTNRSRAFFVVKTAICECANTIHNLIMSGSTDAIDDDEIDDETYADDQDDDDSPAITPRGAIVPPSETMRFVRYVGGRQVEMSLSLDGTRVRMDSTETCTTPEAARAVELHLRELLLARGYKQT